MSGKGKLETELVSLLDSFARLPQRNKTLLAYIQLWPPHPSQSVLLGKVEHQHGKAEVLYV